MARIALIGPGAVGGSVAAWLAQDPAHEVTLCARSPLTRLVVDTPRGTISAAPHIVTRVEDAGVADWVLVATKAYDCAGACAWFETLLAPGTRIAILQNGIQHRARFAGLVEDTRLVPAIVDIPAERIAAGHIVQRRIGTIVVADDEAGRDFVALFAKTPIRVSATGDFASVAWRKLALNCAGAVNALTLRPAGVADIDAVTQVMRGLVRECVAVARAEGVALPDALADEVVANGRAADPQSLNSLLADRLAGRPLEADARNGVIVRLGARHGIATPLNGMAMALLSAASAAPLP